MSKYLSYFIILSLAVALPFILHDGVWLYQDNLYIAKTITEVNSHLFKFLNFTQLPDYYSISFGFDSFLDNVRKLTGYLPFLMLSKIFQDPDIGQFFLIWIFLFSGSIINFHFLRMFNENFNKGAFLGAVFITYSQFFLYFLQLPGFLFSVYGLQLFLIALDGLLTKKNKKWMYTLLLSISIYLIFGYPRLLLIDSLIIFPYLIFLIYRLGFISILRSIGLIKIILISLSILVIFVAIFSKIFSGVNSLGMNSYQELFKLTASSWSYQNNIATPFYDSFILSAPINSFLKSESRVYILLYILISSSIAIYTLTHLFLLKRYKDKTIIYLLTALLFCVFLIKLGSFTTYKYYTELTYTILPFLANVTTYPKYIIVLIIGILIAKFSGKNRIFTMLVGASFLISIFPILNINNYKMTGINIESSLSPEILNTFFKDSKNGSMLYFPNSSSRNEDSFGIKLQGLPYPIDFYQNTSFTMLFSANSRLVPQKMMKLRKYIDTYFAGNLSNLAIFNLKNIIVFNNLENPDLGKFDYFTLKDYITESYQFYEDLSNNTGVYLRAENESFTHFGINNDNRYEYFLYSPANILRYDMDSFFSDSIDVTQKPIVIDPDSFHKPQILDTYEVSAENKNISLQYKSALLESTKIYIKIGDFDSSHPFLLQLNQTFGTSWKVKWISKEEFDEKPCIDEYVEYSITQNMACQYKATLLDLRDMKYLNSPNVSEEHHFEGNFVGNAWLVTPEDIPEDMRGQSELYAVIIYEKQIYYVWALIISGLTFFVLILLTIRESILSYRQQKYDK